ncbi:MAG: hypothetical protein AUH85_14305 [Chloroflexi bacterium 13_1_40CM_4_68_4]|nr:MAG: hypothetical protein AUH85_14305 [Chloroflexi bacterium 13_1_40CM_4_68_4]
MHEATRLLERVLREGFSRWRQLTFDAKVIGSLALANWLLLFSSDTIVQVSRDGPIWRLFPGLLGPLYLFLVGAIALAYPWRDLRDRAAFGDRQRWLHLGAIVALFVVIPTLAAVALRATGQPWTYVHDGALMAEEAARKLLAGHNPYSVDYLDTPLFYWPMVNNPALYHFTYFPLLFLITIPPMLLTAPLGWFDERLLFLPAFIGCLWLAARLVRPSTAVRLAVVAAITLNSQFFPFVIEGRNDDFVLFFVLATLLCLQRDRRVLAGLALAAAAGLKLHAIVLVPFIAVYLLARARPRTLSGAWRALAPTFMPFAIVSALVFVPFIAWDAYGMWDDVVLYNAGASAWSYPVAGIGFSMLLHGLGVIPYRTAEFPFWIFEVAAAIPVAVITMRWLWRDPSIPQVAFGYALTLLAFLFFGRYFQTSYLGYIVAAVTPALFLAPRRTRPVIVVAAPAAGGVPSQAAAGEP